MNLVEKLVELLLTVAGQVWGSLQHNWPYLVVSMLVAAAMNLYLDKEAVAGFLRRHERSGVLAATGAAVATPLCSCGTTAVILGMMAGSMPWAPIVAFMVASPLTSPEELIYSAGLFGWPFATAFFVASILLGLAGGVAGAVLDARGWLRNQARFASVGGVCDCGPVSPRRTAETRPASAPIALSMPVAETASFGAPLRNGCCGSGVALPLLVAQPAVCGCSATATATTGPARAAAGCGGGTQGTKTSAPAAAPTLGGAEDARARRFEPALYLREVFQVGRRLLPLFLAFATIGYLINDLLPTAWITALFGSGHAFSVPLAATLGLPFYINTEASLPLVRGMLGAGMSAGAALAFLITGAGTSIGAVAGAMAIARWRVIGLVVGTLWVGAVLCGFTYNALLAAGAF
jgi:uncharacterized membrane protein YraQ (UPF0718 family)